MASVGPVCGGSARRRGVRRRVAVGGLLFVTLTVASQLSVAQAAMELPPTDDIFAIVKEFGSKAKRVARKVAFGPTTSEYLLRPWSQQLGSILGHNNHALHTLKQIKLSLLKVCPLITETEHKCPVIDAFASKLELENTTTGAQQVLKTVLTSGSLGALDGFVARHVELEPLKTAHRATEWYMTMGQRLVALGQQYHANDVLIISMDRQLDAMSAQSFDFTKHYFSNLARYIYFTDRIMVKDGVPGRNMKALKHAATSSFPNLVTYLLNCTQVTTQAWEKTVKYKKELPALVAEIEDVLSNVVFRLEKLTSDLTDLNEGLLIGVDPDVQARYGALAANLEQRAKDNAPLLQPGGGNSPGAAEAGEGADGAAGEAGGAPSASDAPPSSSPSLRQGA
eukprot:GHVT01099670.1.p1 GENE.GHVT01099670.1~~GHVT01099670.1.p1  ORF type:complete len:395 (+),score=97.43 GHVT01099670.1:438-1622(+)